MFNIVLVEPEIPQNTGNIARTCAATGCTLHLVKPLGFEISDKYLKRAGLDYWQYVEVKIWENIDEMFAAYPEGRFYYFTTKGRHRYDEAHYNKGDFLVFGKETRGLPEELLILHEESCVRIPMLGDLRSLNLSNSAAIAVYEGLRQNSFEGFNEVGQLHRLKWKDQT
ncbi:MAG: tRNA (uridine(34)/cytosine(34)/5-carboxymethylaminomethyluridine(34)-2'-O)-methyltransferase TrmL [Candidatus Coproplasma sp.]